MDEAKFGGELHLDRTTEHAPQVFRHTIERRHDLSCVFSAQRFDEDGGVPKIRREAHLGHGDRPVQQHRIAKRFFPKNLRQAVTDEFPCLELALGATRGFGPTLTAPGRAILGIVMRH